MILKKKQREQNRKVSPAPPSPGIDMNTNDNKEDGDEAKEDDGVNKDGSSTGLHIAKLRNSPFCR